MLDTLHRNCILRPFALSSPINVNAARQAVQDEFDSPVERLLASLANLRRQPTGKGAHFFRTSLRRFEAWSSVFHPHIERKQQDALNRLAKLRKITGKVRDSEIHLELLKDLRTEDDSDKKKLAKTVRMRRRRYQKKLKKFLGDGVPKTIRRSLGSIDRDLSIARKAGARAVSGLHTLALGEYQAFVQRSGAITPENMHEYRLECKRFRYIAELAGKNAEAEALIEGWKTVQDVIGEWHDYLTLVELAAEMLGDSGVHSALLTMTEKKYVEARDAAESLERKLIKRPEPAEKKRPGKAAVAGTGVRTA